MPGSLRAMAASRRGWNAFQVLRSPRHRIAHWANSGVSGPGDHQHVSSWHRGPQIYRWVIPPTATAATEWRLCAPALLASAQALNRPPRHGRGSRRTAPSPSGGGAGMSIAGATTAALVNEIAARGIAAAASTAREPRALPRQRLANFLQDCGSSMVGGCRHRLAASAIRRIKAPSGSCPTAVFGSRQRSAPSLKAATGPLTKPAPPVPQQCRHGRSTPALRPPAPDGLGPSVRPWHQPRHIPRRRDATRSLIHLALGQPVAGDRMMSSVRPIKVSPSRSPVRRQGIRELGVAPHSAASVSRGRVATAGARRLAVCPGATSWPSSSNTYRDRVAGTWRSPQRPRLDTGTGRMRGTAGGAPSRFPSATSDRPRPLARLGSPDRGQ